MAFSNPFGSSSSSSSDSSASSPAPSSSSQIKSQIIQKIQTEQAVTNARTLIQSITDNCFEKCIPSPGSNLSSKDQTCLNSCMEKYISFWNATSKTYISRVGREAQPGIGGLPAGESMM